MLFTQILYLGTQAPTVELSIRVIFGLNDDFGILF